METVETIKKENVVKKFLSIRGMGQVVSVTSALILMCVVFGVLNPNFFSPRNVSNLLRQVVPILIIGIGQSYVLITGNIDLSIGSVIGMSCMISATLMTRGMNPWLAALITLICCIAMGLVSGLLVAKAKLPPFIATLGTMIVARGIAQIANNNYNTDAIGEGAKSFRDFFYYGETFGLFNTVWIGLVIFLFFNFILSRTRTGRYIYAIGSNIEASKLSGVNVVSITTKVYVISAICACIVGLITTATGGLGTMDAGNGYELNAVAASVIGGVSTLGGQGILLGTVVGSFIWGVLNNGLQFAGAPVAIRNIVIGIVVVISVLIDIVARTGKTSKKKNV